MVSRFRWWRRLRGGRWVRETWQSDSGCGARWRRVPDAYAERVEEDWRPQAAWLAASMAHSFRGGDFGDYCPDCKVEPCEVSEEHLLWCHLADVVYGLPRTIEGYERLVRHREINRMVRETQRGEPW